MLGEIITMETVIKEYIDYAKEKSNIDEVVNKKLISQNEKFLKLKEYVKNNHDKELEICREISNELNNMDILKSYYAANFIGHSLFHYETADDKIGKDIIDLFFKNIDNACRFIENASQLYNVDEDELTEDDIAKINIDIMYRLDYKPLEAFIGIDIMIAPIMTVICSNHNLRKYFIDLGLTEHIEYLEVYIPALSYIYAGIEACVKTKILVLSRKTERGFYIEASDMSNGYYLITLLESELYKKDLLKRYGIDNFSKLIEMFYKEKKVPIILIGAKDDIDFADEMKNRLRNIIADDFTNKLSIRELISIIKNSYALIGGDSAPLHIANACGIYSIGIFGDTLPLIYGARGEKAINIEARKKYCNALKSFHCEYMKRGCKTIDCLKKLSYEEVLPHLLNVYKDI